MYVPQSKACASQYGFHFDLVGKEQKGWIKFCGILDEETANSLGELAVTFEMVLKEGGDFATRELFSTRSIVTFSWTSLTLSSLTSFIFWLCT